MNDQLVKLLEQIASHLGMTVTYLWPHVVHVTFIRAMVALIAWGLIIPFTVIGTILSLIFTRNNYNAALEKYNKDSYSHHRPSGDGYVAIAVILLIVAAFVVGVGIDGFSSALAGVLDPVGKTTLDLVGK